MLQVRVAPFQASFPVSFVFIGALAAAVALTGRPVLAQPSGATVNGTVTDESGGVVARADVTLAQASSGVQRRAVTDDRGTFSVTAVPSGTYVLQVIGAGFAPARVEGVTLSAGEQRSFTVTLKVGSLADQVSVTATPDAYVAGPVTVGKIPASLCETPQSISVVTASDWSTRTSPTSARRFATRPASLCSRWAAPTRTMAPTRAARPATSRPTA